MSGTITLPPLQDGHSVITSCFTLEDELACLHAADDADADAGADASAAISVLRDGRWQPACTFPLGPVFPVFDVRPDGLAVVADVRCNPGEANARVFRDGVETASFHCGDGIEHLQIDPDDAIWIGYFDEGVYGETELAQQGLVRMSLEGELIAGAKALIDDCYALNVGRGAVWASWYSSFMIVRLDPDLAMHRLQKPADLAVGALAMSEHHCLVRHAYEPDRFSLFDIHGEALINRRYLTGKDLFQVELDRDDLLAMRNDRVHLIAAGEWQTLSVADLAEQTAGE